MTITLNGTTGITSTGITETSDGNVGIGTSLPQRNLHLVGTDGSVASFPTAVGAKDAFVLENNGNINMSFIGAGTGSTAVRFLKSGDSIQSGYIAYDYTNNDLMFGANGAERARIGSSGSLLVGTTSSPDNDRLTISYVYGVHGGGLDMVADNVNPFTAIHFRNPNGVVGSIYTSGSSTFYGTSSDYRLKEDWVAVADASTRVNALKPVNFAWKCSGTRVDGFLAHELAEVVPEAVTSEKDAVETYTDDEGNEQTRPVYQGIDQSKLVPLLTAALQEALAKIDDLTARVSALEAA